MFHLFGYPLKSDVSICGEFVAKWLLLSASFNLFDSGKTYTETS